MNKNRLRQLILFTLCIAVMILSAIPFKALWILLSIICLLVRWYARHTFVKSHGCKPAQNTADVKDPIIGVDFIYDRLFCQAPDRPHANAYNTFLGHGKTYVVSRWTSSAIHTCDSRNLRHMLVSGFYDFKLPKVRVSVMSTLLGVGIFTLDGTSWARARSVLKPSLARSKLDALPAILEKRIKSFLGQIPKHDTDFDLQPLFFAITMDVATEFLFGRSMSMLDASQTNEDGKQFLEDYMLCSEEAVKRMRMGPLSRFQYNTAASQAKRRVFEYVDKYIDESLSRNQNSGNYGNVLTELADAISDPKLLRDQVLHILLASRDTTASLLSNLFFMLARRPDLYRKLRQEVVDTLGNEQPAFDQLKDMTYLKWCVNECE